VTASGTPASPRDLTEPRLTLSPAALESARPSAPPQMTLRTAAGQPLGRRQRPAVSRAARLYLRLCRITDSVLGPLLLLGVFLLTNFAATVEGLQEFLGMRVTVRNLLYVVGFALAWRVLCTALGLYDWNRVRIPLNEFYRVLAASTAGSAVALVFPLISVTGAFKIGTVFSFWASSVVVLVGARLMMRSLALRRDRTQDVVIVGTGPRALRLYADLQQHPDARSTVLGFVDSEVWAPNELPEGLFLGSLGEFEELLMRSAVDEVLIALPIKSRYEDVQDVLQICQRVGVRVKYLADVFEHSHGSTRFEGNDTVPGVAILSAPDDHRLLIKRVLDIAGAAIGLVLLSPVMLTAALAIRLTSSGPVLFVQPRYGFNRRRFNMLKFRTMVTGADELQAQLEHLNEVAGPAFKIKADPRVTPVGRWLRRTSIDELPQLWNVLRGEMSLVGPRPLPERDVHRFAESTLMRRFSVWPGLTCLWQISGRSETSFERWIELDLRYVEQWSLGLDLAILVKTVPAVLRGTGAT
jgi:exopolysaccharide biosynthesis polyprenyl glycosylphosphotransferase